MLSITVGCMYAGKTSKLMQNKPEGQTIIIDYDRCEAPYVSTLYSHDNVNVDCIKTDDLSKLDMRIFDNIMINEAQFFKGLVPFVKMCLEDSKHIYIYGLDGDFKQEKFGEILDLIPLCDTYVKLYAKCICGKDAPFSKRLSANQQQYLPNDTYRPSCRSCLTGNI